MTEAITPAAGTGAPATGTGTPSAGTGAPAGFDWTTAGLDPADMPMVTERQWKSPKDVLTSYKNLEKLTGVPPELMVKLPKDNDPAAWNEVYTKLGRPADATGYKLPVPEGDKGEFAKTASTWFHEAGLSQSSANKLAEKWNAYQTEQAKGSAAATTAQQVKETEELKGEWGGQFAANCAIVDKAAMAFGISEAHLQALKVSMGPKAAMKFLHNLGSRVAVEGKFVSGDRTDSHAFAGMTPDLAMAKIAELKHDKSFIQLWNSKDPKARMDARQQIATLNQIAYPYMSDIKGT